MATNTKITKEDYFRMNDVFSIWLIQKQKVHFEEMTTKEAKKKFKKFAKYWNRQKLEPIFYDTPKLLLEHQNSMYSQHNWNFKLTQKDQQDLKVVASSKIKDACQIKDSEGKILQSQKPKVYGPARPDQQQAQGNHQINQKQQVGPLVPKFDDSKRLAQSSKNQDKQV